ncbi:MAG TPA: NADH-quinone oxidoreductase subunit A [Armatimonadota bacterium]|mgnify:CR=1 FL=1|nr:NADH-quinone oxidoreductase subunit A [Armatimonadota bacterium]
MPGTPPASLWPLLLYVILAVVLTAALLWLSWYLGERHRERATGEPYESGMRPIGSARIRCPAEFYLVAMFFVIFDLETVFVVAWAISVRAVGWRGFAAVALFIGALLLALGYLWREGALDFGARRRPRAVSAGENGGATHAERP